MTINRRAQEFCGQLNQELERLRYTFKSSAHESSLCVEGADEVYFPQSAGGVVAGGSPHWIQQKHKDGSIHEPALVAALLAIAKRDAAREMVFFDIGALYGYFALLSKAIRADATVFAFEMNPGSYAALRRNISANRHLSKPRIRCINIGLSDRTILQHRSKVNGFRLEEEAAEGDSIALDLLRLDDFCRLADIAPTIIKMDVEGYQCKILPGAVETIMASTPAILLEFDEAGAMKRFGSTNKSTVKFLFDLGYSLFWCGDQRISTGKFERVTEQEMSAVHERNSLGVFLRL